MQKGVRTALVAAGFLALAVVPRDAHPTAPGSASQAPPSPPMPGPADLTPGATTDLDLRLGTGDATHGRQGGGLVASADERSVFAIDEDTASLIVIDPRTRTRTAELHAGSRPVAALPMRDGRVLVVDRAAGAVLEIQRADEHSTYAVRATHAVAFDPVAIATNADESRLFVASGAAAKVTEFDAHDWSVRHVYDVPREPRAIAPGPAGSVFVAHLVGGVISALDTRDGSVHVVRLPVAPQHDALDRAPSVDGAATAESRPSQPSRHRTIASLARALVISRDSSKLFVAHVAESTGSDLPPDVRSAGYGSIDEAALEGLRPIVTVSVLDLRAGHWIRPDSTSPPQAHRLGPFSAPSAMTISDRGDTLMLTSLGSPVLAMLAPSGSDPALYGTTTALTRCEGASGALSLRDGTTLVRCTFDHSVQIFDIEMHLRQTVSIGHDTLSARLALGRRLFHRASDEVSRIGFTCDTCHPDGRDDANVWSSELGNRQTPSLATHLEATAPYQWNGHAPTLDLSLQQTFIRLSGLGMPRSQRDALADFVLHGLAAPRAPSVANDPLVARGAAIFERSGCTSCHDAERHFTDGAAHDIHSANAGDRLPTFDTPTLDGLAISAPYFHDGRYATLDALLADNHDRMGRTSRLDADETHALVSYLNSL